MTERSEDHIFHPTQVDAIHYDDANQLLMVIKGGSIVFAYDLSMDAPGHHEQLVWTYPVQVWTESP